MKNPTTITCDAKTKERLENLFPKRMEWDEFFNWVADILERERAKSSQLVGKAK